MTSPLATIQDFTDRHPVATGSIGTGSGVAAAVLREIHSIAGLAADLGIIFGCLVSFLTGVILIARMIAALLRFWERRTRNRRERRRHESETGPEGDLDELAP